MLKALQYNKYILISALVFCLLLTAFVARANPDETGPPYYGGKGNASYSSCLISVASSNVFKGGKGQSYSNSCLLYFKDRVFLGGKGQSHYSPCETSSIYFKYMYLGGKGMSSSNSCYLHFKDTVFKGGSGQNYISSCAIGGVSSTYMFSGGEGQSYINSCMYSFKDFAFLGGAGQSFYTSCHDRYFDIISRGGVGQSYFHSCTNETFNMVFKGGIGQSSYTSCPSISFDIISRGGVGQTYYHSCTNETMNVGFRGGIGQSSFTSCPGMSFDLISRGGIGQAYYHSCTNETVNVGFRGGKGQSFYVTCRDITSLFIDKTVDNKISCFGTISSFKINVTNKDYAVYTMKDVKVIDSLGSGLNYQSWSATSGTFDIATKTWTIPKIDKDETHTLTINAKLEKDGPLKNYAWIKSASHNAYVTDTVKAKVDSKIGIKRGDIRTQIYPHPHREINLTAYLDTLFKSATWSVVAGPTISSDGKIHTSTFLNNHTFIYSAQVKDDCSRDELKAYVTAIPETMVISDDRVIRVSHEDSPGNFINLNTVFGVDINGTWTIQPIAATPYLITKPDGLIYYDVKPAYEDNAIPAIDYKGGLSNAKVIGLYYTVNSPLSILHGKVFRVVLIITDRMYPIP